MKLKALFSRAFFSYAWAHFRRGTAMDEFVIEGETGYLFSDIAEVPDLTDKIMKDYKRFSYNAWQHSQNFTYEKFKERYLRILSEYKKARR